MTETYDYSSFALVPHQTQRTVVISNARSAAPGMTDLSAKQTDENHSIFGVRYLTIQQRPEQGSRKQRRAAKKRRGKR